MLSDIYPSFIYRTNWREGGDLTQCGNNGMSGDGKKRGGSDENRDDSERRENDGEEIAYCVQYKGKFST